MPPRNAVYIDWPGLMKKLLPLGIVLVGSVASSGPSGAADLPTQMSMKAPAMAPLYSWTGCCRGGDARKRSTRRVGRAAVASFGYRQRPEY